LSIVSQNKSRLDIGRPNLIVCEKGLDNGTRQC
jgi:hypothetical protein